MLSMNSTQESMITASIRSPLRCAGEYPPPGASSQPEGWVPLEVEQTWKSRHSVRVEIPFESTSVAGYDGPLDLPGLEYEVHYAIKEIGDWSGVPDNQWTLYYPYGSDNPDAGGASLWSPPGSRLDGWFVMDCLRSGAMYHFKITLKYYDCHLLDLPQRGPGMPHNCADGAPYILTITVPEIEDAGECPRLNPTTPDCLMLDETTPDVAVPSETTSNTSLPSEEECHASLSSVLSGPVTCAGIDLRGWNPQLDNYDNADFRGAILDGVVFKDNKSFINANFDDASLVGVQVGINASSGCRYTYDDWGNILSRLCDFSGASFQNSDLTNFAIVKSGLNFDNTNFTGANFTGAKLNRMNPDTTCADGYWNFTSLNGAIMDNVDFTVADTFCGLDFVGASLVNTNLSGLTLGQSDFRNANLTGANLSEINREVTHSGYARHFKVDGAIMINANFEGSRLSDFGGGTNNGFMGVDLTGQDFRGFDLERVDFRGAILDGVTFGDNNCGTGSTKVKWSLDFPPVCP